jgi:hypothetical protein
MPDGLEFNGPTLEGDFTIGEAAVSSTNPLPMRACSYAVTTMAVVANNAVAWTKVTPVAGAQRITLRTVTAGKFLRVTTGVVHKTPDTATIAATNPAITEQNSYDLATELKSDYNTHIASTTYHVAADAGSCSLADATTEPTLVALTNNLRTLFGTHAANTTSHGGLADSVFAAAVAGTTIATGAASAITLENALATAWLAHLAVTSAGIYEQVPANTALVWDSDTEMWVQIETSGNFSVRTDT